MGLPSESALSTLRAITMRIVTVPALLLGLGAHILFDNFSRFDGPSVTDFILFGAWQGVALYYAIKTSGFGIIVAFGSATKLLIELNFILDVARCVTIVVGIALGVLFTDFLYKYFDKPPHSSDRRRKKHQSAPTPVILEIENESLVQSRSSGNVETVIDPAPNSPVLSDISAVDSGLDLSPSLSPVKREVHVLRTGASFADSERRRCKEERKWAVSQGNIARASQMKSEVKRYTALMQTFNREAELKTMEVSNNSHHENDKEDQEQTASSSKEKGSNQLESQTHPEYGMVIGVDLGTTYSCIGVYRGGRVEIIPNDQGNRITASWVGFHGDERLIGDRAKNSSHSNPKNTVFDVKRLIGRTIKELEVKRDLRHLPFVVKEKNGAPMISVKYKDEIREFAPEEITAMILTSLKETAEAYLDHRVTHAVVTVPFHFNDAQRRAMKKAGEIAGLKVLRVLNDTTAAALACGQGETGSESKLIVYDLGGGTVDVSLISMDKGVFKVLATAGDTRLGGEDFDNRVIDYLVKAYNEKTGTDVSSNQLAMSKLKRAVELAKHTLSVQFSAKIEIESFENGNGFLETLTRAKFEELNLELFKRTMKFVEQVLKDAEVTKSKIDEVVLVGGSTRIPKVQELLKDYFGKEPSRDINPYEAVAYGAAIQAAVLSGQVDDITVLDINSLTLGIELKGGAFAPMIKRKTVIPTKKSQIFSTAIDNQRTVMIKVFEGEQKQTKSNHLLGEFKLVGILPAPKGVPQVEVTFEVDADSILTIRALDKGTGNSELIVITKDRRRLSQTEW